MSLSRMLLPLLALATGPLVSLAGEAPVLSIGDKHYTMKQLCGSTMKELKARFDTQVKDADRKALLVLLGKEAEAAQGQRPQGRKELETLAWKALRAHLLNYALGYLALAHITDEIQARHQIDLADYFDLEACLFSALP